MWIARTLLMLVASLGARAQIGVFQQCAGIVDIEQLTNSSQLEVLCPDILNYMDCNEDAIRNVTGLGVEFLATFFPDTQIGNAATVLINMKNVTKDLCSNDSDLYKEYAKDAKCLDTIDSDHVALCVQNASLAYEAFNEVNPISEERDEECLKRGYIAACLGSAVYDKCGERAFDTYTKVLSRISGFRLLLCSENGFSVRKTTFLQSLDMDARKKELFHRVFDQSR